MTPDEKQDLLDRIADLEATLDFLANDLENNGEILKTDQRRLNLIYSQLGKVKGDQP
jgi:hypothetical protein